MKRYPDRIGHISGRKGPLAPTFQGQFWRKRPILTASNLTDTNPGATITQVAFYYIDNSGNQHLLGYAAQTSPGVWTLSFSPSTSGLTSGTYTLLAQAEDSYGVFSDPFALTLTVQ